MRCPFCNHENSQVKDSRPTEDGNSTRRRRLCPDCDARFTTFERVQLREMTVVKKNGQQEQFDRSKLERSLQLACRKRPIASEKIELVLSRIVRELELTGDNEISTDLIGANLMNALQNMDQIAYIRYASVYKDFRDVSDFQTVVNDLAPQITSPGCVREEDLQLPLLNQADPNDSPTK